MILKAQRADAHWYHADGTAQHTVIGKNGKERATTLRDARKLNLFPSVTGIIGIIGKPGLEFHKIREGILAAITLPRLPGEGDDAYAVRAYEDSKAQFVKAGEFGSRIHAAIEAYNLDSSDVPTNELLPWLEEYANWRFQNIDRILSAEERIVNLEHGYAGTFDLLAEHKTYGLVLVDFKTQNVKKDKPAFYDTWCWQLAAYRQAKKIKCGCLSLVIDSNKPGAPVERLWTEEELVTGWEIFRRANEIWQLTNDYSPTTGSAPWAACGE